MYNEPMQHEAFRRYRNYMKPGFGRYNLTNANDIQKIFVNRSYYLPKYPFVINVINESVKVIGFTFTYLLVLKNLSLRYLEVVKQ